MATKPPEARPLAPRREASAAVTTLGEEVRTFSRHASPRIIAGVLGPLLFVRLALGRWTWRDLVVAAGVLVAEPFAEWLIHVFVLHARPRRVLGRTIDSLAARRHRAHHWDPRDPRYLFIPLPVLVPLLAIWVLLTFLAASNTRTATTGMVVGVGFLFAYEWTHHLIHSTYLPRTALYRRIWRNHRLHHFKNERFWFGITSQVADRVLRTNPPKEAVETSPTARTLGLEVAV